MKTETDIVTEADFESFGWKSIIAEILLFMVCACLGVGCVILALCL